MIRESAGDHHKVGVFFSFIVARAEGGVEIPSYQSSQPASQPVVHISPSLEAIVRLNTHDEGCDDGI